MTNRTSELIEVLIEQLNEEEGQAKDGKLALEAQHLMRELTNFKVKQEAKQ